MITNAISKFICTDSINVHCASIQQSQLDINRAAIIYVLFLDKSTMQFHEKTIIFYWYGIENFTDEQIQNSHESVVKDFSLEKFYSD